MPTSFYYLCSARIRIGKIVQRCRRPMDLRGTKPGGGRVLVCPEGHRRAYKAVYCQRLGLVTDYIFRELPKCCPSCDRPLRDNNRVTQEDAQILGRIACVCGYAWVWDQAKQLWVPED